MVTLLEAPPKCAPARPGNAPKIAALVAVILIVASIVGYASVYMALSFGDWVAGLCMIPVALATVTIVGGYTAAILFGLDKD